VTPLVARLLLVAGVVVAAVAVTGMARRFQRPVHPPVAAGELQPEGGIVFFSSTDCGTCGRARARLEELGVPVREVTWELEAAVFARLGVEAVPLTVVVAPDGRSTGTFAGVPSRRGLRRALGRAGRPGVR